MPTLTSSTEEASIYEIAVLYPNPLPQKEEAALVKEIETIFADAGGRQVSKDVWGQRGLAYPVDGHSEGTFVIYYYEFEPAKLKEMDHALRILPGVLRHMIIKPHKGYVIVKYSEAYEQWLKERESVEDTRKREREADLQRKVADKAKRQVKRVEETKKKDEVVETKETKAASKEEISKELDKLISADDIDV